MDQQFLRVYYGNEDKSEDTGIIKFASSKAVANWLREIAKRIEFYENSKKYRASPELVLSKD